MTYEVKILEYKDLTNFEKQSAPGNGCGKEAAGYLQIKLAGEILATKSDAMEPEDATFCRDLAWIKDELERAYRLGAMRDLLTGGQ